MPNHLVIWEGSEVDVAVPFVKETGDVFAELRVCKFDRGIHGPADRESHGDLLVVNALPKKHALSRADMAPEATPEFRAARRSHIRRSSRPPTALNTTDWTGY